MHGANRTELVSTSENKPLLNVLPMKKENEVLADLLDYNRKATLSSFNKIIAGGDVYKVYDCEGRQLNSAVWIVGHLTTTENYLCLRSTGSEMLRFSWAKLFGMGATVPDRNDLPPLETILQTMQEVHEKSIQRILSLTDEELLLPTSTGFKLGGEDSYRAVIRHAILHEGMHGGQLSWLCKLNGIKTI